MIHVIAVRILCTGAKKGLVADRFFAVDYVNYGWKRAVSPVSTASPGRLKRAQHNHSHP